MTADFGALMAGVGAFAAVFQFDMLAAFAGAAVAYFDAKLAQVFGKLAVQAHDLGGGSADGGAFQVQLDAFCEVLDIVFLKATEGAGVAGCRTFLTGFNAFLVLMI